MPPGLPSPQQTCDFSSPNPSQECQANLKQMGLEVNKINIYDIYMPCINSGFPPQAEHAAHYENPLNSRSHRRPLTKLEEMAGISGPVECIDAGTVSTVAWRECRSQPC